MICFDCLVALIKNNHFPSIQSGYKENGVFSQVSA